jgi:cytochrome c
MGQLWASFPKVDPASGEAIDLATALRREITKRYGGSPPNKADPAITSLYFYMATKAKQEELTFKVEPASPAVSPLSQVDKDRAEPDCKSKFDEKGWPTGPAAKHVIKGCNLVVNTGAHLRGPIARAWPTHLTCQSCHRSAGNLENAASLAHAAVVLPHMLTSMNQPVRFDRRVLMCLERSMNTFDLGLDAQEITDINLYANWLAQKENLPIGVIPKGRGIQPLHDSQSRGQSFLAGEQVYKTYCIGCHGFAGTGGTFELNGAFPPPIAGPDSFNATASTADSARMAGFVLANMPPGATLQNPVLTEQQALDVSAYLTQLGRPANVTTKNSIQMFTNWLWLRSVNGAAAQLNKDTEQ